MATTPSATTAIGAATSAALPEGEIRGLIKPLPTDREQAQDICQALLDGGAETIAALVEMVGDEFGDPDGAQAKYAVHGLAHHASRPGADGPRKLVAETLAGELRKDHSDELKAFVVRQLQLCGRDQEVPVLAELLKSERLASPAAQALAAIGGKSAHTALKSAQSGASGKRRAAIAGALAQLNGR